MTIPDSVGVYADVWEFIDNTEARCPIVLILDVSRSMEGRKLDTVNRALVEFRDIIREDPVTALRADVAVIAFAGIARVVQDFTNGTESPSSLSGISDGQNRADMKALAKLAPRQPVELTNIEQLDGSIHWLSRSGRFDSPHFCQPGEYIHLPPPDDYLNFQGSAQPGASNAKFDGDANAIATNNSRSFQEDQQ